MSQGFAVFERILPLFFVFFILISLVLSVHFLLISSLHDGKLPIFRILGSFPNSNVNITAVSGSEGNFLPSDCAEGTQRVCRSGACAGTSICSGGIWQPCLLDSLKSVCASNSVKQCILEGCAYAVAVCNECGTGWGKCIPYPNGTVNATNAHVNVSVSAIR